MSEIKIKLFVGVVLGAIFISSLLYYSSHKKRDPYTDIRGPSIEDTSANPSEFEQNVESPEGTFNGLDKALPEQSQ